MNSDFSRNALRALPDRLQQLMMVVAQWVRGIWLRLTVGDRASLEAMDWVTRWESCTDLEGVFADLQHWINLRELNRERFLELWDLREELGDLKDTGDWDGPSALEHSLESPIQRKYAPITLVVASLVLCGVCLILVYLWLHMMPDIDKTTARAMPQQHLSSGVHRTAAGASTRLTTSDGSTITLSELTQVQLDFRINRRHVQLDLGEARFDVVKNAQTPFEVSVDDEATIRAVGTTFRVTRTGPGAGRVVVIDGTIDLLVANQLSERMSAGDSAEFEKNVIRLTLGPPVGTVSSMSSPRNVLLIFGGKPLSDVVHEFNRYNPKRQISVDGIVADPSVEGRYSATKPVGFANNVSLTWGMKYSISHDSNTGMDTIHLSMPGARSPPYSRGGTSAKEQQ